MSLEQSKASGGYEIISGSAPRDYVGPRATLHFSNLLANSIHDPAPICFSRTRQSIRALFNGPMSILANREFPLDRLYPYPSNLEAIGQIYRDIRKMLHDGTLYAALVEEKLVGIGGYMEVSQTQTQKPIIELRRTVIDPEQRGKGMYQALADERLKDVEAREPEATVINATRQKSVIEWSQQKGFSEIDWQRFYVHHKKMPFTRSQHAIFADRVARFRWRYFEREVHGSGM